MIIATRTLTLRTEEGEVEVPIHIHAPEQKDTYWICNYDVDWPGEPCSRYGAGEDAVQAMIIALQMIAIELYVTDAHKEGRLGWGGEFNKGYGFPLTKNVRNLAVGYDAKFY